MNNLETTIRNAVKSILNNTDLSAYRINKVVKAEIANPQSWGVPGESTVTEKSILRYYENIHNSSVLPAFINHLSSAYGINYYKHVIAA